MSHLIALSLIDPSPTQPRTKFRKLDELAASIRALGIQDAITVRASPSAPSRFELIDGERRCRAARIADLEHVPADVVEMDDATIILSQLAHNDAEPLTAVEEGGAYRRLIDDFGQTTEEIALNAGVARSVVWARLRLTFLVPALRALVDEERISQSSAQLIALEPDEVQELIADDVAALWPNPAAKLTRDDVRNLLDRHVRRLELAPFDRTDATLSRLNGSCETCPQNTAAQRSLLPDEGEESLCTRKECWDQKVEAAWSGKVADAERTSLRVLTQEEAAMALDGARVRPGASWVHVDEPIAVEDPRTWRDLERQLAESDANGEGYALEKCALARSGDHFLVLLDAPYAAVYIERDYPDRARELRGEPAPGVVADKAERQASKEAAEKAAELHQLACQRLVDALLTEPSSAKERTAKEKTELTLLKLEPVMAADLAGADVMRAICKRRLLPLKEPSGTPIAPREALIRCCAPMDAADLSALRREVLALAHLRDDALPAKQMETMLDAAGVSLPALRKELSRSKRNVKARGKAAKGGDEQAESAE